MDEEISFTMFIKNELSSLEFDSIRQRALLSAFTKINGKLVIVDNESKIILHTESSKIAKFLFLNFHIRYKISPRFAYLKKMNFNKNIVYQVILEQKIDEILQDLELFNYEKNTKTFVRSDESIRGFLCGAFLATGSVNSPRSSNYHLEISTTDEDFAQYINTVFSRVKTINLESKLIKRKNRYVVYLKKSNQIVDFLAYIGSNEGILIYERERVIRDYENNDNRMQICENANMFRKIRSAEKQIEDIKCIDKVLGIKNITNAKCRLLAELRLQYEEASMVEIANLMSERLDKTISKSSVNHMFRSLKQMADKYRGKKYE